MFEKIKSSSFLPHLVAIILSVLFSAAYYAPQLQSYRVKQSDFETYVGMAKEIVDFKEYQDKETFWTNSMFGGMPVYQIHLETPVHVNPINKVKDLIIRLFPRPWGYMIIGIIGFYLLLIWFRVNPWLAIIGSLAFGFSSINILYFMAGHNSKILAIAFIPPLIGAILYAYREKLLFGAFLVSLFTLFHLSANHLQMTYYALYMVLAIVIAEFIFAINQNRLPNMLKRSAVILIAGILGLTPSLAHIISTYNYGKYTTRGKSELTINPDNKLKDTSHKNALDRDYIKEYSMGAGETWSIVIPNIKGGTANYISSRPELLADVNPNYREMVGQRNTYWGEQRFSGGALYFGAGVFLLFVLGLFFLNDRIKWVLLSVSLLAILLSWKYSSLVDFFIDYVPLYNKFRDTKMMLILAQVAFPFLGILFVQKLMIEKINIRKFLIVSGSVLILFLAFYSMPKAFFSFSSAMETEFMQEQYSSYAGNSAALNQLAQFDTELTNVRIKIMQEDIVRSFLYILATALVLLLFLLQKIKKTVFLVLLGLILLSDLWLIDKRYLNNEKRGRDYVYWTSKYDYYNPMRANAADVSILNFEMDANPDLRKLISNGVGALKNEKSYRPAEWNNEREKYAFSLLNLNSNYKVFSLANPFNNSQPSYYHKFLGGYHGAKLKKYQELIDFHISREYEYLSNVSSQINSIDILPISITQQIPVLNMLNMKYLIMNPGMPSLKNPGAWGNAWFIENIVWVENADDEIIALEQIRKNNAVIRTNFSSDLDKVYATDPSAKIVLESYQPNRLVYQYESAQKQFVVFSEIYFPDGWEAKIDGQTVPIIPVNYILRGLETPPGIYSIEFSFNPKEVKQGRMIGAIGSFVLLFFAAWVVFMRIRRK